MDRVLRIAVDRPDAFTRAELIQATGLSAPTVGSVTAALIQRGVLRDLGTAPSRGGRRPGLMEFNSRHGFVAGIDLGPTRTRIGVGDLRGHQLAMRIVPTPTRVGPEALMRQLTDVLRSLMKDSGVPPERLLSLVTGAPGPVDIATGTVLYAPNLESWDSVPLRSMLHEEFQAATIVIENDVNLALLGEHWRGAARGHETCGFMFVGTGIGAAILIDGTLHHGHHCMAGEIGAILMSAEHLAHAGPRGRLEPEAGMGALRHRWDPDRVEAPDNWFASLMEAYARGDARAISAVEETATLIGMATAQLGAVMDPSIIVLGGSMFA